MTRNKINSKLQYKIKDYLNFKFSEEKNFNQHEEELVINKLSKNLKNELLIESNSHILKSVSFLKEQFSLCF